MRSPLALPLFLAAPLLAGCPSVPPPASQLPSARAAIERMRESQSCVRAVHAEAKADHFGERGRFRGDVLLYVATPARVRMDVVSPFGIALATLASDGERFSLADLRDKHFLVGPAQPCNIGRLTGVVLPGHVLVDLMRGQAPVLKHDEAAATVRWSGDGYYVVRVPSTRGAVEEIHLAPRPEDFANPWEKQRFRVLDVEVWQAGYRLYHARLDEHRRWPMGEELVDPAGIDPPVPPSGPPCDAEVPRKIRVDMPDQNVDLLFRYDKATLNPPLQEGTFTQTMVPGLVRYPVSCE